MDIRNNFSSIEQIRNQYLSGKNITAETKDSSSAKFSEIFEEKVKFSKHADERLATRGINLSEDQIERLNEGANIAREKGICESLVIMDDLKFIVNIKNKTVITAIDGSSKNEMVFTNIDGAVIV